MKPVSILLLASYLVAVMAFQDQDILDAFANHDPELRVFLTERASDPIYSIMYLNGGLSFHRPLTTDMSSSILGRIGKIIEDFTAEISKEVTESVFYSLEQLDVDNIHKVPKLMDGIRPSCRSAVKDFVMTSKIIPTICSFFEYAEKDDQATANVRRETRMKRVPGGVTEVPEAEDKSRVVLRLRGDHSLIITHLLSGLTSSLEDIQTELIDEIQQKFRD